MKKISLFIFGLGGGGAENVCVTLANGLADRGFNIDLVVLLLGNNGVRAKELSDKVRLVALKETRVRFSMFYIWRYLITAKPDVVLCFNNILAVFIGIIRCLFFMKFKLISRNINYTSIIEKRYFNYSLKGAISTIVVKCFYKLSDIFVAQCNAMKKDLAEYFKIDPRKIVVINNPVNKVIENYINTGFKSNISMNGYLLCVGRLEEQKAFHYAIEAFSRISKDYPSLRLKLLGKGSLEVQLRQLAEKLNIANNIDFEGYKEDNISYYVNARLTILTSIYEGFPNVLIESIALGTPVVSFDCPSGPNEIIQDGENGYLVNYEDMEHLTKCIRLSLDRKWNSEKIRVTAKRFSSEKIINEYANILL